jgi:hypothetical protein
MSSFIDMLIDDEFARCSFGTNSIANLLFLEMIECGYLLVRIAATHPVFNNIRSMAREEMRRWNLCTCLTHLKHWRLPSQVFQIPSVLHMEPNVPNLEHSRWQIIPADILFILIEIVEARDLVESFTSGAVRRKWQTFDRRHWQYVIGRRIKYDLAAIYQLCRHWRRNAYLGGNGRPLFHSLTLRWTHSGGYSKQFIDEAKAVLLREICIANTDFDVRLNIANMPEPELIRLQIFPIISQRLRRLYISTPNGGQFQTRWNDEAFPRLRALSIYGISKNLVMGLPMPNLMQLNIRGCEQYNWVCFSSHVAPSRNSDSYRILYRMIY